MTSYSDHVKTPRAKIAFAHACFDLQTRDNGKKQYAPTLLFKKGTDLSPLTNAIKQAAVAEWGEKAEQWLKDGLIKSPILDGDGKQALSKKTGERHPGFAGHHFIRATSGPDHQPKVFGPSGNTNDRIYEKAGLPSGSDVTAVVNAYTWTNDQNGKGVSFGISIVQLVRKAEGDEVLGGGGSSVNPDSFLEKLEDAGDAPASTKTGEGASGLFG